PNYHLAPGYHPGGIEVARFINGKRCLVVMPPTFVAGGHCLDKLHIEVYMDAEMGEFLRKRCAWILKIKTKMQKVLVPRLNPTFWFRAAVTGDSSPSHCAARPFRTTDQQLARQ